MNSSSTRSNICFCTKEFHQFTQNLGQYNACVGIDRKHIGIKEGCAMWICVNVHSYIYTCCDRFGRHEKETKVILFIMQRKKNVGYRFDSHFISTINAANKCCCVFCRKLFQKQQYGCPE